MRLYLQTQKVFSFKKKNKINHQNVKCVWQSVNQLITKQYFYSIQEWRFSLWMVYLVDNHQQLTSYIAPKLSFIDKQLSRFLLKVWNEILKEKN